MKILICLACFSLWISIFGQKEKNKNNIVQIQLMVEYKPATIYIMKDTTILSSIEVRNNTTLKVTGTLVDCYYSIQISGLGKAIETRDSVFIKADQVLVLKITLNGPCLYDHPANHIPSCPENHTDSIIPIVYGLIGTTNKPDSANRKIKYRSRGCLVTGCDPDFYCEIHKIEF